MNALVCAEYDQRSCNQQQPPLAERLLPGNTPRHLGVMPQIYPPGRDLQLKTHGRKGVLRKPRKDNQPHQIMDGYRLTWLRPEQCSLSQLLEDLINMPWKAPRHRPSNHRKEPRPNAHQRGYDRRHRKMREQELAEQPLCVYCQARGKVVAAEVIDHVTAMARGGEALAPENRQPLCSTCNAVKAATTDKGLENRNPDFGPLPGSPQLQPPGL